MTAHISDHALLRWLERGYGFDFEPYRRELEALAQPAVDIRANSAPLKDGLWLVIKGHVVVSVTPDKPKSLLPVLEYDGPGAPHWKHRKRYRGHK